jgi:hypothetical protein
MRIILKQLYIAENVIRNTNEFNLPIDKLVNRSIGKLENR